jgi:Zn-dependent metalloprotease
LNSLDHSVCTIIPPHIQRHLTHHGDPPARGAGVAARAHELRLPVARPMSLRPVHDTGPVSPSRVRRVFDAGHDELLPGKLLLDDERPGLVTEDVDAREAFHASGATYDFLAKVFLRHSIDNRGMVIDSSVHYGRDYPNACWNGRQVIFGDGDGRLFNRFTACLDVVAHELMHGVVQHSGRLAYTGQSGALSEHLADAFGIMTKQFALGLTAAQSDWFIGAGLFGPEIRGMAIRSMLMPGTAYDDKWLGRDPQPGHMQDYDDSPQDNGGVHVNSGIPNRAFALAARELGGYTWLVLGRIWYRVMTGKLMPETNFASFARDTILAAKELYRSHQVHQTVADAWAAVGLRVPVISRSRVSLATTHKPSTDDSHERSTNS